MVYQLQPVLNKLKICWKWKGKKGHQIQYEHDMQKQDVNPVFLTSSYRFSLGDGIL